MDIIYEKGRICDIDGGENNKPLML